MKTRSMICCSAPHYDHAGATSDRVEATLSASNFVIQHSIIGKQNSACCNFFHFSSKKINEK